MWCSPDSILEEVRRYPSAKALEDLKSCLDFASASWAEVFSQLGGAHLLLQVTRYPSLPRSWLHLDLSLSQTEN